MLRPTLTLILDVDEEFATSETTGELRRSYTHVGSCVVRTHAREGAEGSASEAVENTRPQNTIQVHVSLGTRKYMNPTVEGADEIYSDVMERWLYNLLHKLGNAMTAFNRRQRKLGLPEVFFTRVNLVLEGGALTIALRPDEESFIAPELNALVSQVRAHMAAGALADAVRIDMPSDASYEQQREAAYAAWLEEHPVEENDEAEDDEVAEAENKDAIEEDAEPLSDIEAKSYERTAVSPQLLDENAVLEHLNENDDAENENADAAPVRFNFEVDYGTWLVTDASGNSYAFDSAAAQKID